MDSRPLGERPLLRLLLQPRLLLAALRLASVLDGIDHGWESRLSWPPTVERT